MTILSLDHLLVRNQQCSQWVERSVRADDGRRVEIRFDGSGSATVLLLDGAGAG